MGRGKGQRTTPTKVKEQPLLSKRAEEFYIRVVQQFYLYKPDYTESARLFIENVRVFNSLPELAQAQTRQLVRFMDTNNRKRDKTWWPIPTHAWDDPDFELRFFNSEKGVRNVPKRKKSVRRNLMPSS